MNRGSINYCHVLLACALAVAFTGLVGAEALAQQATANDVFIQQAESSGDLEGTSSSSDVMSLESLLWSQTCSSSTSGLIGCSNVAATTEASTDDRNRVTIRQEGDGHRATITQHGHGNALRVFVTGGDNIFTARQEGSGNLVEFDLDGAGNSVSLEQIGDGLRYVDEFDFGRDGLGGSITQQGSNLSLVQEGVWYRDFKIEQTGIGSGTPVHVSFGSCFGTALCSTQP